MSWTSSRLCMRKPTVSCLSSSPNIGPSVIPALSKRSTQLSRATAYRLIRHMLVDMESIKRLNHQPLDWFLVRYVLHPHEDVIAVSNNADLSHSTSNTRWKKSKPLSSYVYLPQSDPRREARLMPHALAQSRYRNGLCVHLWPSLSNQTTPSDP
jgi:putative ribosome biogenesis GTPase RsgA